MSRILVIGDGCRDIFQYCSATRLAPDLPIPIVTPHHEVENGGMALNVQRNIKSLGVHCDILTNKNWREVTKTRIVHEQSNHTFIRIDSLDKVDRISEIKTIDDYDLILISDYNKGFLLQEDIQNICQAHPNVFLDTKKILGDWALGAKYIKINRYEYLNSLPFLSPELKLNLISKNLDHQRRMKLLQDCRGHHIYKKYHKYSLPSETRYANLSLD